MIHFCVIRKLTPSASLSRGTTFRTYQSRKIRSGARSGDYDVMITPQVIHLADHQQWTSLISRLFHKFLMDIHNLLTWPHRRPLDPQSTTGVVLNIQTTGLLQQDLNLIAALFGLNHAQSVPNDYHRLDFSSTVSFGLHSGGLNITCVLSIQEPEKFEMLWGVFHVVM